MTFLKGQYHWANGNKFVGEFRGGLPSGEGVFETKTGDLFVGSFSNGLPNGQGRIALTSHTELGIRNNSEQESLCTARERRKARNMLGPSEMECSRDGENTISLTAASK